MIWINRLHSLIILVPDSVCFRTESQERSGNLPNRATNSMDTIIMFYLLTSIYSPKCEQVNLSNIQGGLFAFLWAFSCSCSIFQYCFPPIISTKVTTSHKFWPQNTKFTRHPHYCSILPVAGMHRALAIGLCHHSHPRPEPPNSRKC